jgi:hypothetical protein
MDPMRKPLVACLALPLLGAAGAAFAGTVYVPVPDPVNGKGSSHLVQIWITNAGAQQAPYQATFLESGTDGTKRPAPATSSQVPPGRSVLLGGVGVVGKVGLVEIAATSEMSIDARLINTPPFGQPSISTLPVISSDNLFAAGKLAVVQGLGRDDTRGDSAGLAIVNLAKQGAQCEVKAFRADGSPIGGTTVLTLGNPLSLNYFADAFELLGVQKIADARFHVTCNQPFYIYATLFVSTNSQLVFVTPSGSGASSLSGPDGGSSGGPSTSAGAQVFTTPGLFHTAAPGNEKKTIKINLQRDLSLKRLVLEMDFVPGPWNRAKIPGNHAVVWLYREKFRSNTIANVNAFGPNKFTLKAAQNIDLPPGATTQDEDGIPWEQGRRYHLKYTYDAEHGVITAVLSSGGTTIKTLTYPSTAPSHVLTVPATGLTAEFGHYSNQEGPEVASFGWSYYDLRIEMVPF